MGLPSHAKTDTQRDISMAQPRIKVTAPATVSNLNCGFDILGLALDVVNDEILGKRLDAPGIVIKRVGPFAKTLPEDPAKNTAGVAVAHFLEFIGERSAGIELEIHKKMRPGSGLGSSASSACAAVLLANELFKRPLSKRELLPFAILGEHAADHSFHADNVAPCLLGGAVLIRDLFELDVHRIYVPEGLFVTVVYPEVRILTSEARDVLAPEVSMKQMVKQNANLGALVMALEKGNFDLIERSMVDHIIEPQRAHLIPGFDRVKEAAFLAGALGCGISGAGPTMFALCNDHGKALECGEGMQNAFRQEGYGAEVYCSRINQIGTALC